LLANSEKAGFALWRDFIVDYGSDQQADLWGDAARWLTQGPGGSGPGTASRAPGLLGAGLLLAVLLGGGLGGPAGVWGVRPGRGRRRPGPGGRGVVPALACYARLLALLSRHCQLRPRPCETPREFAATAGGALGKMTTAATLAGVPGRVAELLYRVRYGGERL